MWDNDRESDRSVSRDQVKWLSIRWIGVEMDSEW
jgi:hypothetical protein